MKKIYAVVLVFVFVFPAALPACCFVQQFVSPFVISPFIVTPFVATVAVPAFVVPAPIYAQPVYAQPMYAPSQIQIPLNMPQSVGYAPQVQPILAFSAPLVVRQRVAVVSPMVVIQQQIVSRAVVATVVAAPAVFAVQRVARIFSSRLVVRSRVIFR